MTGIRRPIVVLGAARSGTKLVRGLIGAHPSVDEVPWDVNFIWKYGNYNVPHDELTPGALTPRIGRFIERSLARFLYGGGRRLVEKTVSNTLRPDFVQTVFPDCVFVHLVRDGRDVAESSRRMWRAPVDWRAVVRKAGAFPAQALPTYGVQYARGYLERAVRGRGGRVRSWGPRWDGMERDAARLPLLELCALQWARSVQRSREALADVPTSRWIELRYEALCERPEVEVARLLEFVGLDFPGEVRAKVQGVTGTNLGKWKTTLGQAEVDAVERQCGSLLADLGYGR